MNEHSSWGILRQVVIATTDHEADVSCIRDKLGLGEGFRDPGLDSFSLHDAIMPVSNGMYIEMIAPMNDQAKVDKWIRKVGGRAGYVLVVQHPDVEAVKSRAVARGIRIPIDAEFFGNNVIQLHPQDVGVVLEVDGIADPHTWLWDDIDPGPEPGARVVKIEGVEVPVADPEGMAELWRDLLDLATGEKDCEVQLGDAWVRFVSGSPSADWNIVLRRADGDMTVTGPLLPGVRFEIV